MAGTALPEKKSLHVLIVEDRDSDARLMVAELYQSGFDVIWERVETEPEFLARVDLTPDLILSDYNLPQFDAPRALQILRERELDIPLIIVSGSIGEDLAVRAIQEGAADYLLKDRLGRLAHAVSGALAQQRLRESNRQAVESLRVTEKRLQQLVSQTPAVIYALKYEGDAYRPDWVSQSVEHLTGYADTEFLAPEWWLEHVHPEDLDRALDVMAALTTQGRSSVEYRFRCRDGSYRWLFDQKRLIRNAMGVPVEIVGSWLDITDRKRFEDQTRQSQKMDAIGRLAAGVAHDLNDLLTAIMGYTAAAADGLHSDGPFHEDIEEVEKAANRAAVLVRQLMSFSRRQMLAPVVLDFNSLLAETTKTLERQVGEEVDYLIHPADRLWQVKIDPDQWRLVLENLIVNACGAMPRGGTLTIETTNVVVGGMDASTWPQGRLAEYGRGEYGPREYVRLTVSDTGPGMDSETQSHVFEPFFTRQGVHSAAGLGLATVYGIVMQSGGLIELDSEPGRGTKFTIYIPRSREELAEAETQPKSGAPAEGNETVLLVEDEEAVRTLVRRVLERNGYTVIEARHGEEALSLLENEKRPIDILVSDLALPGMGGRELAERLLEERPQTKLLYMSGYTDDAVMRRQILNAEAPFLQKPFTPEALVQKVRAVLGRQPVQLP
ncbi:MAG TPA: response regulator [Planctomycetaceae bacterium]